MISKRTIQVLRKLYQNGGNIMRKDIDVYHLNFNDDALMHDTLTKAGLDFPDNWIATGDDEYECYTRYVVTFPNNAQQTFDDEIKMIDSINRYFE